MNWNNFKYKNKEYDLSHLNSFIWTLEEDRKYHFNIQFSMHCFTKKQLPDDNVDSQLLYQNSKETRIFCFERYVLSKQLPEIIKNINNKVCWHTHHGNFFTIEIQNKQGLSSEYEIYFDIYKSGNWLTLIVKSAYIRNKNYATQQPRKRKVQFKIIAKNRFKGKKLRPPP